MDLHLTEEERQLLVAIVERATITGQIAPVVASLLAKLQQAADGSR